MTSEALGEALIPVINKLQDIFSQITLDFKLELPQVAVVGSQSSGKSSVLEALVGRDFLPRGPEICTRRPLVLQLVRKEASTKGPSEYGEFLHAKGKTFTDFEEIRKEIQAETDRIAGGGKGISNVPIRLKICSPHVLTMTLVDLPGITRVPVGDQPTDIESLIRHMIISYIQHPTCIILAVSAANVDLANSDAISMAQAMDPEGIRTIGTANKDERHAQLCFEGVMTKLDIMDKGTNAVSLLKNQVVPLRLGYIGIVNRSQLDINNKTDMKAARKNEQKFFEDNPEYFEVMHRCGIANLASTLNKILVSHIQSMLPGLRMKILAQIDKRSQEMKLYGDEPTLDTPMEQGALLLNVLTEYCQRYSAMLEGRSETIVHDLSGGAKIRDIFQNEFCRSLKEVNRRSELTDETIMTTIRNSTGVSGSLLIPQEPFELLVKRSIKTLIEPAIKCKDYVQEELLRIANESVPSELSRFAALQKRVLDATSEFIRSGGRPTESMIQNLIDCEYNYVNYDHPDFIGGSNAVAEVLADRGETERRPARPKRNDMGQNGQNKGVPVSPVVIRNLRNPVIEAIGSSAAEQGLKVETKRHPLVDALSAIANPPLVNKPPGFWRRAGRIFKGLNPHKKCPNAPLVETRASKKLLKTDSRVEQHSERREGNHSDQGNWFTNIFNKGDAKEHIESVPTPSARTSSPSPVPEISYPEPQMTTFHPATAFHNQMELAVAITRKLVDNYMSIVERNVADMVPKAIMHFMVNKSKKGLHQHLIATLYKEDLFEELVSERPEIAERRRNCKLALAALREAIGALDALPQELAQKGATMTGRHPSLKDRVAYTARLYSSPPRDSTVSNPFDFS